MCTIRLRKYFMCVFSLIWMPSFYLINKMDWDFMWDDERWRFFLWKIHMSCSSDSSPVVNCKLYNKEGWLTSVRLYWSTYCRIGWLMNNHKTYFEKPGSLMTGRSKRRRRRSCRSFLWSFNIRIEIDIDFGVDVDSGCTCFCGVVSNLACE